MINALALLVAIYLALLKAYQLLPHALFRSVFGCYTQGCLCLCADGPWNSLAHTTKPPPSPLPLALGGLVMSLGPTIGMAERLSGQAVCVGAWEKPGGAVRSGGQPCTSLPCPRPPPFDQLALPHGACTVALGCWRMPASACMPACTACRNALCLRGAPWPPSTRAQLPCTGALLLHL